MPSNRQTTWADTTEVLAYTGKCRVKSVQVFRKPTATAVCYIQLWNATNPTPGVTAPNDVIEVPYDTADREGCVLKVNFHGKFYGTGLSWFCSTAATGGTAPTSGDLPLECRLDYV